MGDGSFDSDAIILDAFRGDPALKPLIDAGWQYRDPPGRFSPEMWKYFLGILGEGEYLLVAGSQGVDRDGQPWVRGQLLVSPKGFENMKTHLAAQALGPDPLAAA